jgi:hypothetical protein
VPIGDKKITAKLLLKPQPVGERAVKMAEMKSPGGAHAANDGFHGFPG